MNIILFKHEELERPLPKRDLRTVHLLKVLHKKPGDTFGAGMLKGNSGTGRIESIGADGSLVVSLDLQVPPLPRVPVRIAVAYSRPIQMRRLLRDLANLGIASVDLFSTDLGEKSYQDTKLFEDGGAQDALVEGAIQAKDTMLPLLTYYENLDEWLNVRPWEDTALAVAADNVNPCGTLSELVVDAQAMAIAIGSERGWSERERALFDTAGLLRLSMGSRPLRTETACVAAAILAMEKLKAL
ncbi:RsmE family RNA methyltransferase [Breznakiellaceae bacterium SP9]